MSGSGGVGPRWVGVVDQPTNCDELRFETNLASPVEEVVGYLTVGAELEVSLEGDSIPLVVTRFEGADVGSIVARLDDLIYCLQMGRPFRAIVLVVDDGIVRVEVQPA